MMEVKDTKLPCSQRTELQQVLGKFGADLAVVKGLPPLRTISHAIELQYGAGQVSVHPYQYPHYQKDGIEKQNKDLLQQGVIRNSTSAFSSPVILVKDSSWCKCVDYRAPNKVTVQGKYPTPVVEELLDELHGVAYFSKHDLKSGYHQIRLEVHYEFLAMPFGLTNVQQLFKQR